jgi:predicted AlkP superfamily pyrophosphatase or phosphodiesterase
MKASERIAKYKAKNVPQIVYLRVKQIKSIAEILYANKAENFVRLEQYLQSYGFKLPYEGRLFQFVRELYDLMLSDPERAKALWKAYNLPDEAWDDVLRLMARPARQYVISECRIEL